MNHFIVVITLSMFLGVDFVHCQNGISIRAGGDVEYVVVDPLGRREGVDPTSNRHYREIDSSYGEFSVDSEDPDVDPPEPVNEFMTQDPIDGFYQLTLYGTKLAHFRFSMLVEAQNKGKAFVTYGTIDSNQSRVLTFEYSKDSTTPLVVKKITTGRSLNEDLKNCFKLGFLGGRSLYKELLERVEHIEKRIENKDSSKAYEELEKLAKELKKVREETEKHEGRKRKPSRFVTKEAYGILNEDIAVLMSSLPPRRHDKQDDDKEDRRKNDDRGGKNKSDDDKH